MPYEPEKSHVGMYQCYYCGDDIGILLETRIRQGELMKTLPRKCGVIDMTPCNTCKGYMEQGIILMSISDNTTDEEMKGEPIYDKRPYHSGEVVGHHPPFPVRTHGWLVIKEEAVRRMFEGEFLEFALKNRFLFLTDSSWDALGLPRGEVEGVPTK